MNNGQDSQFSQTESEASDNWRNQWLRPQNIDSNPSRPFQSAQEPHPGEVRDSTHVNTTVAALGQADA